MKWDSFIDTSTPKYTENDREWIACRSSALKAWRKETSNRLWIAAGVTRSMSDSLLMPDSCLAALAKSGGSLNSQVQLVEFLKPWYGVAKHANDILLCLQKNSLLTPGLDASLDQTYKAQKKATLKALRTSKKLKYIDDPKVAKKARLTALRDEWLIACGKPTPETKARMKKAAEAEKKKADKENKARKKAKRKSQAMDIRRLAINNSRGMVGAFKEILSDPSTGPEASDPPIVPETSKNAAPDLHGPGSSSSTPKGILGTNARLGNSQKKKTIQQTLVWRLKNKAST